MKTNNVILLLETCHGVQQLVASFTVISNAIHLAQLRPEAVASLQHAHICIAQLEVQFSELSQMALPLTEESCARELEEHGSKRLRDLEICIAHVIARIMHEYQDLLDSKSDIIDSSELRHMLRFLLRRLRHFYGNCCTLQTAIRTRIDQLIDSSKHAQEQILPASLVVPSNLDREAFQPGEVYRVNGKHAAGDPDTRSSLADALLRELNANPALSEGAVRD